MESDLLLLAAGLALAIFGTALVQKHVESAWSMRLERAVLDGARTDLHALMAGFRIGMVFPWASSSVRISQSHLHRVQRRPGALLGNFLGLGLGANSAAALVAMSAPMALPVLAVLATVLIFGSRRPRTRALGRASAGLALVLLGLQVLALIGPSAAALYAALPVALTGDVFLALGAGALAVLSLRSVACGLLVLATLCSAGDVHATTASALGLGAAIGGCILISWTAAASPQAGPLARWCLWATLASASVCLYASDALGQAGEEWAVLLTHGACSLGAIAIASLWRPLRSAPGRLLPRAALLLEGLRAPEADASVAAADLTRQIARLGNLVEFRLASGFRAFLKGDDHGHAFVLAHDDGAQALYLQIKRQLAALRARGLSDAVSVRWEELLAATVMLDHVGTAAHLFLRRLEQLAQRAGEPPEGEALAEICSLHALVVRNFRMAMALCIERRMQLAQDLAAADTEFLGLANTYRAEHLRRLSAGGATSLLASATHLDVVGALGGMNLQICAFARTFMQLHPCGLSVACSGPILAAPMPSDARLNRQTARMSQDAHAAALMLSTPTCTAGQRSTPADS